MRRLPPGEWILPEVAVTRRSSGVWELLQSWAGLVWLEAHGALEILIERGFRFDLSSVPRLFWRLVAPYELGLRAPLVHDYLYQHRGVLVTSSCKKGWVRLTRAECDVLFRRLIEWEDERRLRALPRGWRRSLLACWVWLRRWAAYYGVRLGGWLAWRKHAPRGTT